MTLPTVHRNGTSRAQLTRELEAAHDALQLAIKALGAAAPNGRDYYLQPPGAFPAAVREQEARVYRVRASLSEVETILGHVTGVGQ